MGLTWAVLSLAVPSARVTLCLPGGALDQLGAVSTRYVWNGCRRSDTPAFVKAELKKQGRVVRETCFTEGEANTVFRESKTINFEPVPTE